MEAEMDKKYIVDKDRDIESNGEIINLDSEY